VFFRFLRLTIFSFPHLQHPKYLHLAHYYRLFFHHL